MVKKIKFQINEEGEVSVSVEGAVGNECEQMTAPFEAALGTLSQKTYKDSYYQTEKPTQSVGSQEESS